MTFTQSPSVSNNPKIPTNYMIFAVFQLNVMPTATVKLCEMKYMLTIILFYRELFDKEEFCGRRLPEHHPRCL